MEIRLSNTDGLPVYRQIVNQVKYLVASGRLVPGQELPAIRTLAERLVINPNTVVHAYGELEKDGIVISRHGSGTYVADGVGRTRQRGSIDALAGRADALLNDAGRMGVGLDEVVQLVRERHGMINRGKQ